MSKTLMSEIASDRAKLNSFVTSTAFPQFYGLSMPLIKYGLPLRPVQLDNIRRFTGYLDGMRFAILSYEFMKPVSPDINATLAHWVMKGGTLIYVGDGTDPFHAIRSWWREAGYDHPAQHLFESLGLSRDPSEGTYDCGEGRVVVRLTTPALICLKKENSDAWRDLVKSTLAKGGVTWEYRNDITLRRGPYVICEVMDESVNEDSRVFEGCYADLMEDGFPVIGEKTVRPDEGAILSDLSSFAKGQFAVVATAARVLEARTEESELKLFVKSADKVLTHIPKEEFPAQTLTCELYLEAGIRACEIGYILADRDPVTRENRFGGLDFVRLCIPRRESITRGLKITKEAPLMRHFTVELERL